MQYEPKEIPKSYSAIRRFVCSKRGKSNDTMSFRDPDYFTAFIGVTHDGHSVYNYNKMIEYRRKKESITEEDARKYIDYTVIGAYIGNMTPYIAYDIEEDSPEEYLKDIDDPDKFTYIPGCDESFAGVILIDGKKKCLYDTTSLPPVILECKYANPALIMDPYVYIPSKKHHNKKGKRKNIKK